MGMFDTIILSSDYKLKLTQEQQLLVDDFVMFDSWNRTLQTKSIRNELCEFVVAGDGSIRITPGTDSIFRDEWTDFNNFTGEVECYTSITCDVLTYDLNIDITLDVKAGVVTSHEISIKPEDNNQRIQLDRKFAEHMKRDLARSKTLRYKIYKSTYRPIVRFTCDTAVKTLSNTINIINRCRRKILFW